MKFCTVEIHWPGFDLRFVATEKRISSLLDVVFPQVIEAENEWKQYVANPEPEYQI